MAKSQRMGLTCSYCFSVPPLCDDCMTMLADGWRVSAVMFGRRWGASVLLAAKRQGRGAVPWPEWPSDRATKVREIARVLVAPLAGQPERRDPRLVEVFAGICGQSAAEAHETLTTAEARALVAEHDRAFPNWRRALADISRSIPVA